MHYNCCTVFKCSSGYCIALYPTLHSFYRSLVNKDEYIKQSPVNTTDLTSIESLEAYYQHASLSQRSY